MAYGMPCSSKETPHETGELARKSQKRQAAEKSFSEAHLVGCQLVVGEEWVSVHAAGVLEVLPPLQLNKLHGPELEGQQADNVEGQVHLGGGIVPEDIGAGDLLWWRRSRRVGRGSLR